MRDLQQLKSVGGLRQLAHELHDATKSPALIPVGVLRRLILGHGSARKLRGLDFHTWRVMESLKNSSGMKRPGAS